MTVRGISQNVIETSSEASVQSAEFGNETVSVASNVYVPGKEPWPSSWQQPISWSDMRKYFDPVFGVDARKLIDDLESNVQSLEDHLDTAFIKAYGGVAQGVVKFLQGVFLGPNIYGWDIEYNNILDVRGVDTGASNYMELRAEGLNIKTNRTGVDTYISMDSQYSFAGDQIKISRTGSGTASTFSSTGNITIYKRNPVLRIEETGGADNVDLELMQSGLSTEGLRIRYESGTGNSRITNIYNAGNFYLHTSNTSSNNGIYIDSDGHPRLNKGRFSAVVNQLIGSMSLVGYGYSYSVNGTSTLNNWVTLLGNPTAYGNGTTVKNGQNLCIWGYSCYVASGGRILSRVLSQPSTGGSYAVGNYHHFSNESYSHKSFTGAGLVYVDAAASYSALYLQYYGDGVTAITDSNDYAWLMVFAP